MASMSIRIDDNLRDEFSSICKKKGIMGSAMIRGWMEEYIKENSSTITKQEKEENADDEGVILSFKINSKLNSEFDMVCKRKYLSKSAVIRNLVEDFCKENEQ